MHKYYDQANKRLVFVNQRASADFWDQHWQDGDLTEQVKQAARNHFYVDITQRFLPANSSTKILEGGCGQGGVVLSLSRTGYNAYGVDYASETIAQVQHLFPQLNISVGDVSQLAFPANHFHGYWSLGVIEHNYSGYQPIIQEMARVIKPRGYLFITFPHISRLRQFKASLGVYPAWIETSTRQQNFYQFALSAKQVITDLVKIGFIPRYHRPVDGLKGLKDEIKVMRTPLRKLASGRSLMTRKLAAAVSEASAPFCGHVMLCVLQKRS